MAKRSSPTKANPTQAASGAGGFTVEKFVLAMIIIGLGGAAAGFVLLGNFASAPALQTFASTNESVPTIYSQALSGSDPNQSITALSTVISDHQNSTSQFSVNYTGTVYAKIGGSFGTVSSPLYMWEAQNGSSKRMSITVQSASIAGMLNVQYLLLNGTFVCANFNATAATSGNIGALLSKSSYCKHGNVLSGINLAQIYRFNFAQLSSQGLKFTYAKSYQSTYHGVPCTVVSGTISGPGSGQFIMCMSDTYYVPLSIGINFTGQSGKVVLILNETSIGNYSTQGAFSSLPYPVS